MASTMKGARPPKEKRTLAHKRELRAQILEPLRKEMLPEVKPHKRMTPEVAEEVLEYVRCGGTLIDFARESGMPQTTVNNWLLRNRREDLAKAREQGAEVLAEKVVQICTTPSPADEVIVTTDAEGRVVSRTVKTADNVYARKLAAWGVLEIIKCWAPDRFGKRVTVEAGGRMAEAIALARGRVGSEGAVRRLRPSEVEVVDVQAAESAVEAPRLVRPAERVERSRSSRAETAPAPMLAEGVLF